MEMIKTLKPYFNFKDERGLILGLVQEHSWKEVNLVTSKKGTRRGDHYHKLCRECFIILEGKIRVHLQSVRFPDKVMTVIMLPGDVFIVEPDTNHTFEILENSKWLNMLDTVLKDDMYKVS
jgi:quercetin dioxygenase-like cupin family protein